MVIYIKEGDIFALDGVNSYAHGCNCAGAMGKGIALQFRNRFPEMYREYKFLCLTKQYNPGDVFDYDYGEGHIYNLATQQTWRSGAKIEYIEASLNKMMEIATLHNVRAIAMPAIGAGLGGLKWDDVKTVIDTVAAAFTDVNLYVVETYKQME